MAAKIATFQERFNELLESSPKSRSTIASEFGVAKQTISAWATGQSSPRTPTVSSLAEYFNVNLDWLVGFDVPMRPERDPMMDLQFFSSEKPPDLPVTPEARILAKGIDKMPAAQREAIMNMMTGLYPGLFEKGPEDDDT